LKKTPPPSQIELIDLFYLSFNDDLHDIKNLNKHKKTLYDLMNKLIKYSDNIDLVKFIEKFYNLDEESSIKIMKKDDDKNCIFNFKHCIGMFWLGLSNEKNIVFNRKNNQTNHLTIDFFDECKPNVIKINGLSQYENIMSLIEEKEMKKNKSIDTLILDGINLEDKQIELPFQITNVKIKYFN
jgi:hypothetical protein